MNSKNLNPVIQKNSENSDQISFNWLLKFLSRNIKFITSISFLAFFIAAIISFNLKKIWKGKFQIVIQQSTLTNSGFANLNRIGLPVSDKKLDTEVGILKSPSVLMPIFDFVKQEKRKTNKNWDISFEDWKKEYLSIKLQDFTSILEISYKDNNKKLIIPVLDQISKAYQLYSGKNKRRSLELEKAFLEEQVSIYKDKSSESFRVAQEYGMDKDLSLISIVSDTGAPNSLNISPISFPPENSLRQFQSLKQFQPLNTSLKNKSIEKQRVDTANEIKEIEINISKIEALKDGELTSRFISNSLDNLTLIETTKSLNKIQEKIVELKSKYKKSEEIEILETRRDLFINLLKDRTLGFLKAKKLNLEARLESLERPKEVLLKYNELVREASRDEKILFQLEDQLRLVSLNSAKITDPWELITKPTLKEKPVAPVKRIIAINGFLIGFIISIIYLYFKEKQSDLIYDADGAKIKFSIPSLLSNSLDENLYYNLKSLLLKYDIKKIYLVSPTDLNSIDEKNIVSFLNQYKLIDFVKLENNLENLKNNEDIVIQIYRAKTKFKDLETLIRKIELNQNNLRGLISI